jgi:hypothetical protein
MTEMVARGAGIRRAVAVRVLERRVAGVAGEVSASRYRQLRMVVGMWERALPVWPADGVRPGVGAAGLFDTGVLEVFWDLAVAGRLRLLEHDVGRPLTIASQRVVRDCLGILAELVVPGRVVELPVVVQQEPRPVAPRGQFRALYRELAEMAAGAPGERDGTRLRYEDRVRLLAIVSVVLDTGCRSAELEAMRLDDLGEGLGEVLVRRVPQNGTGDPVQEVCALSDGTRVALRRWLLVRRDLVAALEGTQAALWVSMLPNQWQDTQGFALRAQGIRKAYSRGMWALNTLMGGRGGWEPMPTTLEQLRRAVVEPEEGGVLAVV